MWLVQTVLKSLDLNMHLKKVITTNLIGYRWQGVWVFGYSIQRYMACEKLIEYLQIVNIYAANVFLF